MTSMMKHRDSAIFPDPDKFDPARWIAKTPAETAAVRAREKCLVPFSRGSRSCIGQNLAMCEVYVFLGTFFRRFGQLEAYDVGPEDMELLDYFTPFHRAGSRPFKVAMRKE